MARINVEDKFWNDSRFRALIGCFAGDEEKAAGRMLKAWHIAQDWWSKGRKLIPPKIWEMNHLGEELFKCSLAQKTEDGIYVSGSREQFDWIFTKREAGRKGGEASGKSRRKAPIKTDTSKQNEADIKKTRSKTNPLTLTPSLRNTASSASQTPGISSPVPDPDLFDDPLSSTSPQQRQRKKRGASPPETVPLEERTNLKIAYFAEQWREKYKANYSVIPREAKFVKDSFKGIGLEKFKEFVDAYLKMHEAYFISRRHDLTALCLNVPKVSHFAQTGIKVSRQDANQIELREHNSNVFSKIAKERENET